MGGPTTGDRIWHAVLQLLSEQESLTVADVLTEIDDAPARQTTRQPFTR
jgi:predicted DNA-binding ribbon-helix-helix protein